MRWSITLIRLAIALAGAMGVLLPTGHRWAVLLPLLAGLGIGIAGLAFGSPDINDVHSLWSGQHLVEEPTELGRTRRYWCDKSNALLPANLHVRAVR